MRKWQGFIFAVIFSVIGCSVGVGSTGSSEFTTYTKEPDALFRDYDTDIDIRWNRFPRLTAYDDFVQGESPCQTKELACIEFPFPLVIPRQLNTQGRQKISDGYVRYYAISGPSKSEQLCDAKYFTVITEPEGSDKFYQFEFSQVRGLQRVAVVEKSKFNLPIVGEVFSLVKGRIFDHGDICP